MWSDEREDTRILTRNLLELYAKHLSGIDPPLSDSQVDADIIRTSITGPQDRVSSVMFHELIHWAINALFSDAAWIDTGLPPAIEEGFALMFDDEAQRIITGLKNDSNVSIIKPLFRDQPCASEQREINWGCYWYNSINHKTRSPGELALLNRNELHDGNKEDVISNYADSWALVYLFGESIIVEALTKSTSIQQIIEKDSIFSTPWETIQNDIKNRAIGIPNYIVNRFNDCR